MRSLRFVEWDRFTFHEFEDGRVVVDVYGWIAREEDDYKDFLHVAFWPKSEDYSFTTSSDRYSEEIHQTITGEKPDTHNPCHRVEHTFNVGNAVELETKTLGDYS